jgi:hypothetical protein
VVLVTERFRELAAATRRSRGIPEAPEVVLPVTEATEYGGQETMQAIADQALREALRLIAPGARGPEAP